MEDIGERLSRGEMQQFFARMDHNHDGKLDFEEFLEGMHAFITVLPECLSSR